MKVRQFASVSSASNKAFDYDNGRGKDVIKAMWFSMRLCDPDSISTSQRQSWSLMKIISKQPFILKTDFVIPLSRENKFSYLMLMH